MHLFGYDTYIFYYQSDPGNSHYSINIDKDKVFDSILNSKSHKGEKKVLVQNQRDFGILRICPKASFKRQCCCIK